MQLRKKNRLWDRDGKAIVNVERRRVLNTNKFQIVEKEKQVDTGKFVECNWKMALKMKEIENIERQ